MPALTRRHLLAGAAATAAVAAMPESAIAQVTEPVVSEGWKPVFAWTVASSAKSSTGSAAQGRSLMASRMSAGLDLSTSRMMRSASWIAGTSIP